MRKDLYAVLALLFGAILLPAPAVRADDATPQVFLETLYRAYEKSNEGIDIATKEKAARYFTPEVTELLAKDFEEAEKRHESGRLDFDPFTGGQDWEPTKIAIKTEAGANAGSARGEARFTFPGEKTETVVKLDLTKTAEGWRIADIHWGDEPEPLLEILKGKE